MDSVADGIHVADTEKGGRLDANWQTKLETDQAEPRYAKRKRTGEPVLGSIKSVIGYGRFHHRGHRNVAREWLLIALA